MTTLDFLVLTLAGGTLIDVWWNGSIFHEPKAYCEVAADSPRQSAFRWLWGWVRGRQKLDPGETYPFWMFCIDHLCPRVVLKILNCAFCMSHHTPWLVAMVCFVPGLFVVDPWASLLKLPAYCLAATRLGNIVNAVVPPAARYENRKHD